MIIVALTETVQYSRAVAREDIIEWLSSVEDVAKLDAMSDSDLADLLGDKICGNEEFDVTEIRDAVYQGGDLISETWQTRTVEI